MLGLCLKVPHQGEPRYQGRTWKQELKQRHGGMLLTVLLPWLIQPVFMHNPEPNSPRGGTTHTGMSPPINQEMPPTDKPTDHSKGGNSSVEGSLFPGNSSLCQIAAKTNHHRRHLDCPLKVIWTRKRSCGREHLSLGTHSLLYRVAI